MLRSNKQILSILSSPSSFHRLLDASMRLAGDESNKGSLRASGFHLVAAVASVSR